jgi:hypothetical protein
VTTRSKQIEPRKGADVTGTVNPIMPEPLFSTDTAPTDAGACSRGDEPAGACYAIHTTVFVERHQPARKVRKGSWRTTRTTVPDSRLYENCRPGSTAEEAAARAEHLSAVHRHAFVVLRRDPDGEWRQIDGIDRSTAEAQVLAERRASSAVATRRRREKKDARSAQTPLPLEGSLT